MSKLIAFAASVLVNIGALGALQWTLERAQEPPAGEVSVRELVQPDGATLYAQSAPAATAARL